MQRLFDFVFNPMVYGVACAVLFFLADYAFPQYTKFVVIVLAIWGLAVGLAAANQHGKTDPAPPEDKSR
jgi:hypothetical protein